MAENDIQPAPPAPSENPYAAPQAELLRERAADRGAPARYYPLSARFWAANIDLALAIIFALMVGKQLKEFGAAVQGFAAGAIYLLYFFLPEAIFAATLGKWLLGIRVADLAGRPCTPLQALVRTLMRLVDVNPVVGALPAALCILTSKRKQRLGDRLAGTIVVRK